MRPEDVGFDKGSGSCDRTVDVGFRREVHQRIDALSAQQLCDQLLVADVAVYETEVRAAFQRCETATIARVRERIQHQRPIIRVIAHPAVYEVAADEPGTSCYEQSTHF